MGSFFGGGSNTTTVRNELPQWVEDAGRSTFSFAENIANRPLYQYGDQLPADYYGQRGNAGGYTTGNGGYTSGGGQPSGTNIFDVVRQSFGKPSGNQLQQLTQRLNGGTSGLSMNPGAYTSQEPQRSSGRAAPKPNNAPAGSYSIYNTGPGQPYTPPTPIAGTPIGEQRYDRYTAPRSQNQVGASNAARASLDYTMGSQGQARAAGANATQMAGQGGNFSSEALGRANQYATSAGNRANDQTYNANLNSARNLGNRAQQQAGRTGEYRPELRSAEGYINQGAGQYASGDINRLMNPYIQAALDPAAREIREQGERTANQIGSSAIASGNFGGSRQAILESENNRNTQEAIGDLYNRGYSSAFDRATSLRGDEFGRMSRAGDQYQNQAGVESAMRSADMDRLMQAGNYNLNEASVRDNLVNSMFGRESDAARLGLQEATTRDDIFGRNFDRGLDAGRYNQAQQQIDNDQFGDYITRMAGTGATDREVDQQQRLEDYERFLERRDYPMQQLNTLLAAISGVPYATSQSQNGGSGSGIGDAIGTASSIASLFSMFSDRNSKENIVPVSDEDALASLRGMPVSEYTYRPEAQEKIGDDGRKHIGPMAQDYAQATGNGDGTVIPMDDILGRLVGAVRALDTKIETMAA